MLCKFTINYTKISSHGLINKHEQFILNNSSIHIFTQKKNSNVTIHINSKPSGYCSRPHKIGIFSTRFKAFETEITAKTSLRMFLTIYMVLKQGLTQLGKDSYLLELSELHQIGAHARRVEQLSFLLHQKPTVRSATILERSGSLSLSKTRKFQPLHPISSTTRFCPFCALLEKMNCSSFVLFLIKLSFNTIHFLKSWIFDTWHYLGHPFPSSLYSCNMCHMSTCYR